MIDASPWQRRLRRFVGLPPERTGWPTSLQQLPEELESSSLTVPFSLPLLARARQLKQDRGHRVLIGLNGPVGAGKSTLARQLQALAPRFDLSLAVASIDDAYRPLGERRRVLAGNPFGVSRVPPGSHDVPLLLTALEPWRDTGILRLPRFDKGLAGGEGERNGWTVQQADVVLLEGWFIGCQPLRGAIADPDPDGWLALTEDERAWLPRWDGALEAYTAIWDQLDALWVLRPTRWSWPRRWRFQAEARQRRAGGAWLPTGDLEALVRSSLASLPPALYQDPLVHPIAGAPGASPAGRARRPLFDRTGTDSERAKAVAGPGMEDRPDPRISAEVVALLDGRRRCRWSGLTEECPIRPPSSVQLSSESASSATG